MRYQRIAAFVPHGQAEIANALLAAEGFAIEILDDTTLDVAPSATVGYVVYRPLDDDGAVERLRALFARHGIDARLVTAVSDEDDWRDRWKAFFKPRRVGPFVLVPSWESFAPAPGDVVVDIDPGRAFGTGGHPSTRLCLEAIGRAERCASFADVGCGSGVLAIACALRFPSARGLAVDVDPEALAVTRENAERNRVLDRLAFAPVLDGERRDLVLANLQLETIVELAPSLSASVAAGGRLVLSGLLVEQADRAARAFPPARAVRRFVDDEWCALEVE